MGKRPASIRHLPAGARLGRRKQAKEFNNKKVTYDGYKFDSLKECERYKELALLQKANKIQQLVVHPRFSLTVNNKDVRIRSDRYPNGRKVSYYGDFSYYEYDSDSSQMKLVIEDVKGDKAIDTPISRLKRAIVEAQYGVQVKVVR